MNIWRDAGIKVIYFQSASIAEMVKTALIKGERNLGRVDMQEVGKGYRLRVWW